MVLDEGHHTRRVGVEVVIDKRVIKSVEAVPPSIRFFVLGLVQLVEEREVHHRLQIRIALGEFRVFLPGSGIGRLRHPCLTHGIEVGILLVEFLHPLCHSLSVCVGVGIHTDAIDAHGLNPPDRVLDEVAHQVGIMLVQVRH